MYIYLNDLPECVISDCIDSETLYSAEIEPDAGELRMTVHASGYCIWHSGSLMRDLKVYLRDYVTLGDLLKFPKMTVSTLMHHMNDARKVKRALSNSKTIMLCGKEILELLEVDEAHVYLNA